MLSHFRSVQRAEAEETTLAGGVETSPPRTAPKKLPSVPKSALAVTKPASPAPAARSANGTHASYGPFYLEYSLLAEFTLVVKQKLPGVYVQPSYRSALGKMWNRPSFLLCGSSDTDGTLACICSLQCGLE